MLLESLVRVFQEKNLSNGIVCLSCSNGFDGFGVGVGSLVICLLVARTSQG